MTKKATTKKTDTKSKKDKGTEEMSVNIAANRRKEWRFDLPLDTIVEGKLPQGKKFKEKTTLTNISSGGAYFRLDSGVTVGSKLNLMVELPEALTDGKKMKLCLGGLTVRLQKISDGEKKQGIALSFDEDFQVIPEEEEKKK